eukprot:403340564
MLRTPLIINDHLQYNCIEQDSHPPSAQNQREHSLKHQIIDDPSIQEDYPSLIQSHYDFKHSSFDKNSYQNGSSMRKFRLRISPMCLFRIRGILLISVLAVLGLMISYLPSILFTHFTSWTMHLSYISIALTMVAGSEKYHKNMKLREITGLICEIAFVFNFMTVLVYWTLLHKTTLT